MLYTQIYQEHYQIVQRYIPTVARDKGWAPPHPYIDSECIRVGTADTIITLSLWLYVCLVCVYALSIPSQVGSILSMLPSTIGIVLAGIHLSTERENSKQNDIYMFIHNSYRHMISYIIIIIIKVIW